MTKPVQLWLLLASPLNWWLVEEKCLSCCITTILKRWCFYSFKDSLKKISNFYDCSLKSDNLKEWYYTYYMLTLHLPTRANLIGLFSSNSINEKLWGGYKVGCQIKKKKIYSYSGFIQCAYIESQNLSMHTTFKKEIIIL